MCSKVNAFKDKDGFTYKHPERSCKNCLKYPCIPDMDTLKSNFASYGCLDFDDSNVYAGKRTYYSR